jgi:hypothetical protein
MYMQDEDSPHVVLVRDDVGALMRELYSVLVLNWLSSEIARQRRSGG